MISKERLITDIKRIGKRRVEYFRRSMKKELNPVRVTRRQLNDKKAEYDAVVNSLAEQMERYRTSPDYAPCEAEKGTVLFEGFRILSYNGDIMGKVLSRDGHIYRGVYKESVPAFLRLWNSGLLQVLGDNGYIPVTTVTDYYTEEYPIIMEHEIVDMSTSKSWNLLMIKDACIAMAIIKRAAASVGYTLYDGHLNNMTFHAGRPVFTDIGSIVEDNGHNTGYTTELFFAGLYRLVFAGIGNSVMRRIQIYDEDNNSIWITPKYYDDAVFECYKALKAFKRYHFWHSSPLCSWMIFRMFDCYDARPEFIELVFGKTAGTAANSEQAAADIEPTVSTLEKLQLDFASAVDVGGTSGRLALEMHRRLSVKVLAAENDEARSHRAYELFRKEKAPINTMMFQYLYGADDGTRDYVRSEAAIALDITHNMRSYQRWKPDSLINSLSKMTEKYAVVTFHPDEKYSTECFEQYFADFFEIVHKADIGSGGIVLVGRKK